MAEDPLSKFDEYMAAIYEVKAFLQNNDDNRSYLELLLDLAVRHTAADYGYLLLRKADDPTYQVIVAQDREGNSKAGDLDLAARSLLDQAEQTGVCALVTDAFDDERLASVPVAERTAAAYLIVPLLLGSRVPGLICLVSHIAGQFSGEHQSFVDLLSTQAALVVERERQAQIIRRVEDSRSEFISLTTHELRVPLTSMSGYTDIILSGKVGPLTTRQEEFLRTIRRNVDRMAILINALGEMNRIDGGRRKFNLVVFDLTEILEAAILEFEKDVVDRQQNLVVDVEPSLPSVLADRAAVLAVLTALIDNASRYSPDEAIISLQISLADDMVRLEIVDQGGRHLHRGSDTVIYAIFPL